MSNDGYHFKPGTKCVGNVVFWYSRSEGDATPWTIKDREVELWGDVLVATHYVLSRMKPQAPGSSMYVEETRRVTPEEIFDTAKEAVFPHVEEARNEIAQCADSIVRLSGLLKKWSEKYFIPTDEKAE